MKKTEALGAVCDRHRSPSANEIYSSARVFLQSGRAEGAPSAADGGELVSTSTSPDRSELIGNARAAFGKDDGKYDPSMSGGKHIKELRPPVRLRSKSAISENELPSNDGLNALLPVKMERSKTNSMPSEGSDLGGSPPLNYSPHELVVPLSLGGVRSSPGQKEMASIRKKLFTSSSQDASGQGGAFLSSATAPAAMLRANIPPRHNGGQSSAPSSLSLTAPDGLSVITSPAPGIVLDGVLANESRTKSEGGRDRGVRSNGKVSQEKKSLQGVKRPPLSKEKIINKSSRDNDLSLLDLSGEESMASSPPSVNTSRPRRQSKAGRTVEPIQKRPVLDKKSLTKPDGPDFSEGSFPSKQVHLVPVKPMPDPLSHSAGPSISRECSLDDMPSSAAQEDQASSVPAKTSPGDNKVKVSAMRMEAVIPENKSHVLAKEDKIQKPMSLSPPMQSQPQSSILDFNLSYSESESGGALSSSLGGRSAGPDSPPKSYSENDNILLQRIQEAQALNRKEIDDGAVMHKFSLWSNVDPSHFRPAHVMAPSDEIVAPDKKPAKVRGPRAAIKSDGDAIMCFDDSPEEADPVRLSSSTAASAISSSGNITVFKTRDVFAVDSAELDSSLIRADRVQIGAALGASGAMAMALRNMVDSTKMPPSPYVQNADEEEFSYLNTCGSVDSLDEMDGDVDFMSSIDETEMLSRATSVEVDGEDYQLHDSEEEDNNERKGYKYSVTPKRNVGSEGPSVVMVSSADTTVHVLKGKTNILNVDLSATLQKSEENGESIISSVNSALDTERKVRESDTNATYITPPREANPIRMEYDSANVFVHHSQPASARRISGDSNSSMQFRNVQGMSLDQMKMIGADKSYSMGNSSIISDDGCGFDADNNDIVHNGSDDRSVDFTLRERRRHNQHRMSHGHVNETENRISSANSATRAGRKQGGKQAIPWVRGEPIGQGTFGRVYRGMNEGTGELLAVKQITLVDGADGEVHSLRGEIRLMKSLNHTNIVRYLGTSVSERYLFIIMEYVPGGSVAGMLNQFGAFSEPLISRFIRQILNGVVYLHGKGIIHRDIKGANVLVTDAGVAKLADFGCSKQLVGLTTASLEDNLKSISGSVPWMAPEVIKQTGHGLSADIWSVGATVIEMITAKHPWQEFTNSLAALFHVATSDIPPTFPPKISSQLNSFLGRCLVIKPDERSTAIELQQHPFIAADNAKVMEKS